MTTNEVAVKAGCSTIAARKWAFNNGVSFVGTSFAKIYIWTEEDYERFLKRPKPGKRAKSENKKNS